MEGTDKNTDELWIQLFEEWLAICDPVADLPLEARLARLTANVMEEITSATEPLAPLPFPSRPSVRL